MFVLYLPQNKRSETLTKASDVPFSTAHGRKLTNIVCKITVMPNEQINRGVRHQSEQPESTGQTAENKCNYCCDLFKMESSEN